MIIGIAGKMNSGKDTVASMLNYIISVGKNKAKFSDWVIKQEAYNNPSNYHITHFALGVKSNLSMILTLPIDVFNDRTYKDELWYVPSTGKFIKESETNNYYKIELENFSELDTNNKTHIIKIRTIIQTYAEQCKTMFGNDVWVKCTMANAITIDNLYGYCIIPDVRFNEEVKKIWEANGVVIKITRPKEEIASKHISEKADVHYNYEIINQSNLSNLFYKVLAIYEQIKTSI